MLVAPQLKAERSVLRCAGDDAKRSPAATQAFCALPMLPSSPRSRLLGGCWARLLGPVAGPLPTYRIGAILTGTRVLPLRPYPGPLSAFMVRFLSAGLYVISI